MAPVNVHKENIQHFLVHVILAQSVNSLMVSLVNSAIQTACFVLITVEVAKNVDLASV